MRTRSKGSEADCNSRSYSQNRCRCPCCLCLFRGLYRCCVHPERSEGPVRRILMPPFDQNGAFLLCLRVIGERNLLESVASEYFDAANPPKAIAGKGLASKIGGSHKPNLSRT